MDKVTAGGNARVLFCGDFNTTIDMALDHLSSNPLSSAYSRGVQMQQFIDSHDLTDVWRAFHPDEQRYSSFSSGRPTHIDLVFASPAMLTHIADSSIQNAYASDHTPLYVDLVIEKVVRGPGVWWLPQYVLADPVYVKCIHNVITKTLLENAHLDRNTLWEFLKVAIRSDSIQFIAKQQQAKKAWVKHLFQKIGIRWWMIL